MLFSYKECIEKFGSKYMLKKALERGEIFQQDKGVYSDKKYVPTLEVITWKYPKAIYTMNSAFYYYGLTDVIPEKYYLMTKRGAAKIADKRVVQIFENNDVLEMGVTHIEREGCEIPIYSKERMLVELMRNKNKMPFDYYKEILINYRRIIDTLDIPEIQDYVYVMPKSGMIMEAIQMEVF
jgi:hypothetical protein